MPAKASSVSRYGVVTFDSEGRVLSLDPGAEAVFGFPSAGAKGRALDACLGRGAWERCREAMRSVPAGRSAELDGLTVRNGGGEETPVSIALREVRIDQRVLYAAIVREVARPARAKLPGAGAATEEPPAAEPACAERATGEAPEDDAGRQPAEAGDGAGAGEQRAEAGPSPDGPVVLVADDTPAGERIREALEVECGAAVGVPANGEALPWHAVPVLAAVNLAAGGALAFLRGVARAARESAPHVLAYVLPGGAPTGFWIGAVSVVMRPAATADVVGAVGHTGGRRRAMVLTADPEAAQEVQPALAALRISAAVVLDGRQAGQLVSSIRPDLVVAHLSPRGGDVHRALGTVLRAPEAAEAGVVLVVDAEADPREAAWLRAGANLLSTRGTLRAAELPARLTALLRGEAREAATEAA